MNKNRIVPCLWFDDQAEGAAEAYTQIFPAGRINARSHYPESGTNPSGKPPGSVLTVEFEIAGQKFTGLNGGPQFTMNPSISFFVHVDTPQEADRIFDALAEGGQVLMPIDEYPWSVRFGWVQDRFGVSWQVITGAQREHAAKIAPCMMFTGAQHGRAEEAIGVYTNAFPNGRIENIERYAPDEGPEGTVKHGRFVLDGTALVAMDSHAEHQFGFNEGLSLQVMCEDQAEVDHFWAALSEGGEPGPCGWLKDRFGVSWQVVPESIVEWLTHPDVEARDRAFQAMMTMGKIDIATLQAALEGA